MASGDTLCVFGPTDALGPGYGTQIQIDNALLIQAATSDLPALEFVDGDVRDAYFIGVIPQNYAATGGIDLDVWWAGSSTTNEIRWEATMIRIVADSSSNHLDGVGWSYPSAFSVETSPTAVWDAINSVWALTAAQTNSVAAGDMFMLKVSRNATHIGDDNTGVAEIYSIALLDGA